jgi:hypothetical protein
VAEREIHVSTRDEVCLEELLDRLLGLESRNPVVREPGRQVVLGRGEIRVSDLKPRLNGVDHPHHV